MNKLALATGGKEEARPAKTEKTAKPAGQSHIRQGAKHRAAEEAAGNGTDGGNAPKRMFGKKDD